MSVPVYLNFESPLFRDCLRLRCEWPFPFLPRIGESIGGWVWIDQTNFEVKDIEPLLSEAGKKYMAEYLAAEENTLKDWLYEMNIECSMVFAICYSKKPNSAPNEVHVEMWLNDTGKQP